MANSKNTNLFYRLYSTSQKLAQSGFVCTSRVDETETSFDITNSKGVITDSNGTEVSYIDLSQLHASGVTEYYTATKIIGPKSVYLLHGNVTGETYAAQFFPVQKFIQAQDGYQNFINLKFCIQYVACSKIQSIELDTYKIRTEPGDVCEMIQNKFNELGIPVAVSIKTLDVCDCEHADCITNNQIDYICFQSEIEGYQFFVFDAYISAIDYTYQNFNGTWADYTESPFVIAGVDFDSIVEIIRAVSPRKVGKYAPTPYAQIPCDIYRWLITLAPTAVTDADVFIHNYKCLEKFAELFNEVGELPEENYQQFSLLAAMYNDIYTYYFGLEGSLCRKYNIHDLLKILNSIAAYVHNSNVAGPYELIEDYSKRLYPQKYPNGAFRGVVMIPDWPEEQCDALKIAHVADTVIVNEQIQLPRSMRLEGYVCNGCKDVFIRHEADVKVNCLLQSELEVYNTCGCCLPVRKVVSNDGVYNSLDDDVWTYTLHEALESKGKWTRNPSYADGDDIWSDYAPKKNHVMHHHEEEKKESYEDYVEESRTPSKYDWLANIPGQGPNTNMEPVRHSVGLYRYMQHLSENDGWTNVGDGYMVISPEDDYQSVRKNLQNSMLVYNPNDIPIRVGFLVFS